jgi:parvulin-like peptidyl-prolyl isomerase
MKRLLPLWLSIAVGCDKPEPPAPPPPVPKPKVEPQPKPPEQDISGQPARVTVQHILIAFQGSMPKPVTRTKEEAEKLAKTLLERAQKGEDFSKMTMSFSDDSPDGVYSMFNFNAQAGNSDDYPRKAMAPSFGDVSFSLKVGEIGIASYHPQKSPYGWHIIKRLK